MKVKEINTHLNQLATLADKKLPAVLNMAIAENILVLKKKSEITQETIKKLCEQYSERDENGNVLTEKTADGERYKLIKEKIPEFQGEYNDLMELDSNIEFTMVSADVIEKADADRYDPLTPGDLICLNFMIEK